MSVATLIAAPFGALLARQIDTSVVPLLAGYAVAGAIVLALVTLADRVR